MTETISTEMIVTPVTLEGKYIQLEPLLAAHHAALTEIGLHEDLWRWIPVPVRRNLDEAHLRVRGRVRREHARGAAVGDGDEASALRLPFSEVQLGRMQKIPRRTR